MRRAGVAFLKTSLEAARGSGRRAVRRRSTLKPTTARGREETGQCASRLSPSLASGGPLTDAGASHRRGSATPWLQSAKFLRLLAPAVAHWTWPAHGSE